MNYTIKVITDNTLKHETDSLKGLLNFIEEELASKGKNVYTSNLVTLITCYEKVTNSEVQVWFSGMGRY